MSAYPLANLQLDQLGTQVSPQDFGLPGDDELRSLLAEDRFVTRTNQNSLVEKPQAPRDMHVPHSLENNASHYHQPQSHGSDRVSPNKSSLPGEQDIQRLLSAEFNVNKFDAPVRSPTPAPDFRFYFLEADLLGANKQPVFGNSPKQGQFAAESQGFDVQAIRRDFPILSERVNGKPLVWFDNAATTQKPKSVIE
ncbi:MAG: cysteine desulfurase, partial [Moraxellaceae bacterium]